MVVTPAGPPLLPAAFCWTKYGSEAGEAACSIFRRKERERQRNGGIFLWGVGNGVGPSLVELLRVTGDPRVLFSPIKSRPRVVDENPSAVVMWTSGVGLDGASRAVPEGSVVTSRETIGRRSAHYALVCESADSLSPQLVDNLHVDRLRNLRSGSKLGTSQVTSVVGLRHAGPLGAEYPVTLMVRLVEPFFLRLADPVPMPTRLAPDGATDDESARLEEQVIALRRAGATVGPRQPMLV